MQQALNRVKTEKDDQLFQLSIKRKEIAELKSQHEKRQKEENLERTKEKKGMEAELKRLRWESQQNSSKLNQSETGLTELRHKHQALQNAHDKLEQEKRKNLQQISELNQKMSK